KNLLARYLKLNEKTVDYILDFHHEFESIHPYQDGNGRVGRLIVFKECLKYDIVPFIIYEDLKWYYYRGLSEWNR
ncbi:Fic family protein, partial [Coprococcus eutactus]|uniref:Fic family protein n=1 Tax=Coprococcus eutactus TaxID=33043 RepID=UPI00210BEACE